MFPGSPARILPRCPLRTILALAPAPAPALLGVWLRGCTRPQTVRCRGPDGPLQLLISDDLGYLLCRGGAIVLRDADLVRVVPAPVLLGYRILEIVLAAPYLPPPDQLKQLFPRSRVREGVVAVPIGLGSAEEALAVCAAEGVSVAATRIAYRPDSVDSLPAGSLG
jgi:hypothetical protein